MRKKIALLIVVLLLASCVLIIPSFAASSDNSDKKKDIKISNFQNLNTTSGVDTCGNGIHGGHQTRILHTSHGTYAAYVISQDEGDIGANEFAIIKIENGISTVLYKDFLPLDSSSVNIFCDENEEVYVAAIPDNKYSNDPTIEYAWLCIYHLDSETGMVTGYNSILPFANRAGYGYSMPCIDTASHKIYALFNAGDDPGYIAWFIFDLDTMTWEPDVHTIQIDYRHCYTNVFADGSGGVFFVAERDITKQAAGHPEIGFADYVWDDLCLFRIPDMYSAKYTQTNIALADYSEGHYYGISNNGSAGDTYLAADGLLHVLYTVREYTPGTYEEGGNVTLSSVKYHAVYEGNTCIYNEQIQFSQHSDIDKYAMRMAQSTDGTLYIIAMPSEGSDISLELWKATDAKGLSYELYDTRKISDDTNLVSLILSSPRNNSIQDNTIDCLATSCTDQYTYLYFQLDLPVTSCTIQARAPHGGSISPSGNVSVDKGMDMTFTILAEEGYEISDVKVDGHSIGIVSSYTFNNISSHHTIIAIFSKADG